MTENACTALFLRAVSRHEIFRAVMSFSSDKALGFDKVTMSVIKDAPPCILPVLTDIVNRSLLLSSVFSTAWKISEVVSLPKDGDHEIPNNNRPVSLLPAASKICERVALNQLMTYMTIKKRLSNKKLHSCETLNVMITDKALEAMDAKKVTLVVLLEFSKAFDSVDHAILLAKLQALGVSRASSDWFKSYLSERLQCVRIGAETSSLRAISHGVPQGSILGPTLFTIYLNNIPSIPDVCSLKSYVDDPKLYLSFPVAKASIMTQQINKDLEKIARWCCYNSLLINPEKTKLLVLGTRQMLQRLPADFHVTLLGKKVTPSPSAGDLGLQIDSTLSYDEHVTQTVSSRIGSLCQINKVKHLFDAKTLNGL
ncbi:RNA-directed DNA polymerase from mobile element jockey [Stylophora pistillata]|uniref:RNA-directed DNA polymerase from mobile element jockey n=1 Tax=Stylophora pistillata TaxID=50429 RepID=A0A2B4RRG9_STYPI|nr:RNA-directed DNA polymerase from mobile element jockey [Stylophora pistillata]